MQDIHCGPSLHLRQTRYEFLGPILRLPVLIVAGSCLQLEYLAQIVFHARLPHESLTLNLSSSVLSQIPPVPAMCLLCCSVSRLIARYPFMSFDPVHRHCSSLVPDRDCHHSHRLACIVLSFARAVAVCRSWTKKILGLIL
jgi:hypothetical protein